LVVSTLTNHFGGGGVIVQQLREPVETPVASRADRDTSTVLEVRELRKVFRSRVGDEAVVAVDGVSFTVTAGEIFALLGHSGCGKTTVLRSIIGLEQPDSGDVILNGRSVLDVPTHKRDVGLVFQDLALFPDKTVSENVAFGLRMKGTPRSEIRGRVEQFLELVELPPATYGRRLPSHLSGGEQQRVALARTLVLEPSIILFDEPLASLDRRLRDHMTVELRQLQKRVGLPAVYVTHDQEVALKLSDRMAVMHWGRIEQMGSPVDIYRRPKTQYIADFIGDMNFLAGEVVEVTATRVTIRVGEMAAPVDSHQVIADHPRSGDVLTVGMRPEDVRLTRERTGTVFAKGTLQARYFSTGEVFDQVALPDGQVLQSRSYPSDVLPVEVGATVLVSCDPTRLILLEETAP
jgi:ABC-type Fe3+/spermidine/putrescine transport system ATPase subunit